LRRAAYTPNQVLLHHGFQCRWRTLSVARGGFAKRTDTAQTGIRLRAVAGNLAGGAALRRRALLTLRGLQRPLRFAGCGAAAVVTPRWQHIRCQNAALSGALRVSRLRERWRTCRAALYYLPLPHHFICGTRRVGFSIAHGL
jgi:hypothetical protein